MRRYDPDRRDRIIDAAIDTIAEVGVAGTSNRKVAIRADVPLGSLTYHFDNADQMLHEAFSRFAAGEIEMISARLGVLAEGDVDGAVDALVILIHDELLRSQRSQVLLFELYTLAARRQEFRSIVQSWIGTVVTMLRRLFDDETAQAIDAYVEGAAVHVVLDPTPQTREQTRATLARLAYASRRAPLPAQVLDVEASAGS